LRNGKQLSRYDHWIMNLIICEVCGMAEFWFTLDAI
jgi:hypothetical protein